MARKQEPRRPSLEAALSILRQRHGGRKLAPPLEGLAYRFTIWLPILAGGQTVFSPEHRLLLSDLFHDCFGGFSHTNLEGFPPWSGSWFPSGADEPIVDHHVLFVVYALQDAEALKCLRQLKSILQRDDVAAQQVVLIEKIPVHLIETAELD